MWGTALSKLKALFPTHACKEFNQSFPKFDFRCVWVWGGVRWYGGWFVGLASRCC